MQTIRKIIFGIFAFIGALLMFVGVCALDKKQKKRMEILLESLQETLEDFKDEVLTIEDEIFLADTMLTKKDYKKGTNKDLSVECRICGEITSRGKYYKRVIEGSTSSEAPYLFICKDCYHSLPDNEDDYVDARWLIRNDIATEEIQKEAE